MKKLALGLVLCGLSSSALAISNPNLKPAFADLTWYANKSAVKQQMVKKGYVFSRDVTDAGAVDSVYTGTLVGIPVQIRHWFNNKNQLVKTSIVFNRKYDTNLYSDWETIKKSIDGKYGKGLELVTVNKDYKAHSSLIEMEIENGKSISSIWMFPTYKYAIGLEVSKAYQNDPDPYVNLSYESPAWGAEMDRREASSDF